MSPKKTPQNEMGSHFVLKSDCRVEHRNLADFFAELASRQLFSSSAANHFNITDIDIIQYTASSAHAQSIILLIIIALKQDGARQLFERRFYTEKEGAGRSMWLVRCLSLQL